MRIYRSTLLAVLIGASSIGGLQNVNGQSFGYPENSKSLFSRWADQNQKATMKRLIGGKKDAASPKLVERIQSFDTRKSFSLTEPHGSELSQSQRSSQTSWVEPLTRNQAARSILEVVEQPTKTDPSPPRYRPGAREQIPGIGPVRSVPQEDFSRVAVPPAVSQPPAVTQAQPAPNYRTAAHPISILSLIHI